MMKKIISFLVVVVSVLLLVACGSKNTIPNGKYYEVFPSGEKWLKMEVKDNSAFWHPTDSDEVYTITNMNAEQKQFTISAKGQTFVFSYEISKDGKLTILTGKLKGDYYREGSNALKEFLKKASSLDKK